MCNKRKNSLFTITEVKDYKLLIKGKITMRLTAITVFYDFASFSTKAKYYTLKTCLYCGKAGMSNPHYK